MWSGKCEADLGVRRPRAASSDFRGAHGSESVLFLSVCVLYVPLGSSTSSLTSSSWHACEWNSVNLGGSKLCVVLRAGGRGRPHR